MGKLTITAKGQVTLNKRVLGHLGVGPGDKVELDFLPDGSVQVHAERKKRPISDLFGSLKRPGQKAVTIEEMNETIAKGWAGQLEDNS